MKAMSVGMIFVLIFAIIVMGFVLVFSLDMLQEMFCFGGDAQVNDNVKQIENNVRQLYRSSLGSSNTFKYAVPGSSKICFVNTNDPEINLAGDWKPDPDLEDIISQEGYNVWMYRCSGEDGYRIPGLNVTDSFCVTGSGQLYIENAGLYVVIEKYVI